MRQIYTTNVPELTYDEISAEADGLRLSFAKKLIAVGNDIDKAMEAPELDVESMEYKVLEHINDRLAEMLSSFTSWSEQRFIAREIEG
jgi:hypothetical protein